MSVHTVITACGSPELYVLVGRRRELPQRSRLALATHADAALRYAHALAPILVGVLVPLLITVDSLRAERLLRQRLAAPVALVSALGLPLVLVTPVELPFTCRPTTDRQPSL